ncbi:hypothetical protein ART_1563 [Arthrobacter sp. PAMC 25486]|nr:hypothetical protein ART_1563 [Arthrobacter sp. PAMC 25486]
MADAATDGITTTVTVGGEIYDGNKVVTEGQEITMKVQYGKAVGAGTSVKIKLGAHVTLGPVPAANDAIESIKPDPTDPNSVILTFKDPWPSGTDQGVVDLKFTVNKVERSAHETIKWNVDGEESSLDVIVKNDGDDFASVNDGSSKWISNNGNLGHFVSYDAATGKVTLAAGAIGAPIKYSLAVDTREAKPGYSIADQLPEGMVYDADSFTATQTSWDPKGLNKETKPVTFVPPISGNTFNGSLDLPATSKTVIEYKAVLADEAARAALEAQLQTAADMVEKTTGGNFSISLTNIATFGDTDTRDAAVSFGGKVPADPAAAGPNTGKAFWKNADWETKAVSPNENGALVPPLDITYTLNTDLSQWDGNNVLKTLKSNVVISDPLPPQARWNTADAAFVTATGIVLEKVEPVSPEEFANDKYVGKYFVDGQTLYINVGKDASLKASIAVKAIINSIDKLNTEWTNVPGETKYKFTNRANWNYVNGTDKVSNIGYDRNAWLTSFTDSDEGFKDDAYFKKESTDNQVVVKQDESATIEYKFSVGEGKGVDLTKSKIVDYVDSNVFDLSDLAAIKAGITAQYDWWHEMGGELFDVSLDADGNLVIALNAAGIALVNDLGLDKHFELILKLETKPVTGKQTLQVKNKATLFGEDDKALYWSETSTTATSFGDEAEVRKEVRDTPNAKWTQNLRAEIDADGNLVQRNFVYNVALIPHGTYDGVKIFDVVDVLPAGVEFVGFVADANVDDGANPLTGTQDLNGNVQARFDAPTVDAPSGKVVLFQKEGTVLDAKQGEASVNILVRITDFKADEAIVNVIGSNKATITPSDGYPLGIAKLNSTDQTTVISDEKAHFQIIDAAGEIVVDNVFVQDNALRVRVDGEVKNVTVRTPGTYTVKEIKAPSGYAKSDETIEIVVGADGSSQAATFYNTPVDKSYAVGDYVWVDADKNGLQGDSEVLEGVKVTLLNGAGEEVATTHTDAAGWYMFDELPAGEYQVKFELTDDQKKLYNFTVQDALDADGNANDAKDSDVDPSTGLTAKFTLDGENKALTKDYDHEFKASEGIDPTWDAGVVLKWTPIEPGIPAPKVSVGDFVWVDSNGDGRQDEGEPGIEGVVLDLFGPDGTTKIGTTTTDKDGKYTFENLPVLKDGESYTVTIDQEKSAEALKGYVPTKSGAGDREGDSSEWTAKSEGLTNDGDRDPSLDFGFVLKATPIEPTTPVEPPVIEPTTPVVPPVTEPTEPTEPTTPVEPPVTEPGVTTPSEPAPSETPGAVAPSETPVASAPAPTTAPATDVLSNTGFDGAFLMGMGLLLTLLGGGAVALTARRRRTSPAQH